jgi:hypothetical protein
MLSCFTHCDTKGIMDALENDQYEVALGPAAGLHKQREALFAAINE